MVINIAFDQEFGNLGMLGRQGENEETRILIDCRSVLEEHPDAVIGVRYMGRVPGEEYYDLSVTDAGDGVYEVVLSTYDLRLDGNKELQVRALEGEWERKSRRFYGYVAKSLFDFRPPAGPVSDYLARLMAALRKAEDAQMQGPVIGENGHWYIFDGGAYVDTGVKAEGRDGTDGYSPTLTAERMEDGVKMTVTMKGGLQETFWVYDGKNGEDAVSPTVSVEEIEGGHRITIADIDGEKIFDVMDGKGGQGGGASVELDTTLTQSGKAADAWAVGDALNGKISANGRNVQNANLALGAVTTGILADQAVTAAKIASGVIPPAYTLPIATPAVLGGVKPVAATADMTQAVGVDADGLLFTAPGGGASEGVYELLADVTIDEDVKEICISTDMNGEPFELTQCYVIADVYPALAEGSSPGTGYTAKATYADVSGNIWFDNEVVRYNTPNAEGKHSVRTFQATVANDGRIIHHDVTISFNDSSMPFAQGYVNGLSPSNYVYPTMDWNYLQPGKYITRIYLSSYAVVLGAGTRVIVYGIRK